MSGAARRLWQGFNRGRRRFRRWRRGRPFWGGLFLMLGGVQLFLSTQMSLMDVEISFGSEGFLAIVLPVVLLLCGALLWATPQHRYFYSVIGTVTAVYSLLGLNLGGWFLGMLFGVLGGALGFAWTPVQAPPVSEPEPAGQPPSTREPEPAEQPPPDDIDSLMSEPDDRPTVDLTGPLLDETPGQDQQAPVQAPRQEPRGYAAVAMPLLLVVALAAPTASVSSGSTAQIPCLIPVICPDDDEDEEEEDAEPDPTDSPSPTPSGEPGPTPGPSDEPDQDPEGEDDDSDEPDPTETPTPEPTEIPTLEPDQDHPLVAANPALMTADRLDQERFLFEGITELPTADGPIEVLQFSFSRSTADNFSLAATANGQTTTVTADPLVLAGDVTFYTSRFNGRLAGVLPLELTPGSPLVDLLELVRIPLPVFFTDVELDLVFTHGAELTATGFALD